MITEAKLRIYHRFRGDIDGFGRGGSSHEKSVITDDEWHMIDILWQRLALEQNVPCAESFRVETQQQLSEQVADAATAAILKQLAQEF